MEDAMKRVKLFLSVAAVAGMTALMGVGSAEAGTVIGKITLVDDFTSYDYIYITPLPTPGSATPVTPVYYCTTANHDQRVKAAAAVAGNKTIRVYGSGTTTYLGSCAYIDLLALN
jgi:hypothetical protein